MTPQQRYMEDLSIPGFRRDPAQLIAVDLLQQLYDKLQQPAPQQSWFQKLTQPAPPAIMGLYLWGGVGRGKTYLMDMFYDALPMENKHRVHFHRFMQTIHEALKTLPRTPDPLEIVAKRLAQQFSVICLDEFHVHDIGDAMLLSGLLKSLFDNKVTLVTTSNIEPNQLYKNGLQRERFLPAIALIEANTHELKLDGERDYRLEYLEKSGTYHIADTKDDLIERQFMHLVATDACQRNTIIDINHREIKVQAEGDDVVWFEFDAICATARSAADYLEISRCYHTVLLSNVPILNEDRDDVAQRFIHLIDALYDHHVKLVISAFAQPEQLYSGGRHSFSFERTVSRLQEMSSEYYLSRAHRT